MNSQGYFIRFYSRKSQISLLITHLILLISFIVISIFFITFTLADIRLHQYNFYTSLMLLLEKFLTNDNWHSVFTNIDFNLIFLMAGLGFIATYYWIFSVVEIFILKQDYQKISTAWRISSVLFIILATVLYVISDTGGLKFVACFISFCGFLASTHSANINKIKAKLQKEHQL